MEFFALLLGLGGLWLGTEATIRGAVSIAERLGVSEFIVGVAILSIGSDLPELAIAVDAAIKIVNGVDASDLVVGSSLGSSLGQIGFVLGAAGLIAFLTLPRRVVLQHGAVLLGSIVFLGLFGYDGIVTRTEGISLVILYAIYLWLLLTDTRNHVGEEEGGHASFVASILYLLIGLAIIVGSAELTVESAKRLAVSFNIEQSFIAIIIIGLGSSLPELSISLAAVIKRRTHLSVGNLIGSNVFDTLVPVGVAAAITDLQFNPAMLRFEVPFLFILTLTVLHVFATTKGIKRYEAAIILEMYLGYAVIKFATA